MPRRDAHFVTVAGFGIIERMRRKGRRRATLIVEEKRRE